VHLVGCFIEKVGISLLSKKYIKRKTNSSKSTVQQNSKGSNYREKEPRKIPQTKNIFSGQNHKNTNP
jgi:hypothetical protein